MYKARRCLIIWADQATKNSSDDARTAKTVKPRTVKINNTDDLLTHIAKLGGINRDEAKSQGIDPAYSNL